MSTLLKRRRRDFKSVVLSEMNYGGLPQNYYRMDDVTGTTLTDAMGATNGTLSGSPTLQVQGLVNRDRNPAMTFASASSQYARVSSRLIASGAYSIECLFTPSNVSTTQYIVTQGTLATGTFIGFRVSTAAKIAFVVDGATIRAGGTTLVIGTTYHVCFTYDAARTPKCILYLNGVSEVTSADVTDYSGDNVTIAGNPSTVSGALFNGTIDEVAVYRYVVAVDRILYHTIAAQTGV